MNFKEYLQTLDKYINTHYHATPDSISWYLDKQHSKIFVTLEFKNKVYTYCINYEQFEQFCIDNPQV